MCNRYSKVERRFWVETAEFGSLEFESEPRYNIAPSQIAPVVVCDAGKLQVQSMKWGWSKGVGPVMNAKAETAAEKPMFREAWGARRCVAPADGFYEWRPCGDGRQGYRFVLESGKAFWFAGLWDKGCFLILTGPAEGIIECIHDRLPVILSSERVGQWLGKAPEEGAQILRRRVSGKSLQCYPVCREVNSPRFESAEAIRPAPITQTEMFPLPVDDPGLWPRFAVQ